MHRPHIEGNDPKLPSAPFIPRLATMSSMTSYTPVERQCATNIDSAAAGTHCGIDCGGCRYSRSVLLKIINQVAQVYPDIDGLMRGNSDDYNVITARDILLKLHERFPELKEINNDHLKVVIPGWVAP
jgi:hypothetical protein